jgi:poly(A) polymerase
MTGAELLKLLGEEDPRPAIAALAASGALAQSLGAAGDLERFSALVGIETEQLFAWDPLLRLAALLPDRAAPVAAAAERLGLADPDRRRLLAALSDPALRIVSYLSPRELRRAIYRIGAPAFRDRVQLAWAAAKRSAATPQWRMLLVYPETWIPPDFPITDDEIRAAGRPAAALLPEIRREIEEWWIDLDFTDDKMAAVERLKAVVQGLAY